MSGNISTTLFGGAASSVTASMSLVGGASSYVDIYVGDSDGTDVKCFLSGTYAATAATTGLDVRLKAGWGMLRDTIAHKEPIPFALATEGGAPGVLFADNYEPVTTVARPLPSKSFSQTVTSYFFLYDPNIRWPKWFRIEVINTDATNTCSNITLRLDL